MEHDDLSVRAQVDVELDPEPVISRAPERGQGVLGNRFVVEYAAVRVDAPEKFPVLFLRAGTRAEKEQMDRRQSEAAHGDG